MQTIHVGDIKTGTPVGKDSLGAVQPVHNVNAQVTEPSIVSVSIDSTDPNNQKVKATGISIGTTHVIITAMNSQNQTLTYTEDFTVIAQPTATVLTVTWA